MKKKHAIRPIKKTSPADARPVSTASGRRRAYPDAKTLGDAIREAAARAVRIAAIPTVGLFAGCTTGSGDAVPGLSPLPLPWQGRIGSVVEGLRAPEDPVPLAGTVVPVQPDLVDLVQPDQVDLIPVAPPPPPPLVPDPIPLGGAPMVVDPTPPEPPPPMEHPPTPQGGARPVSPDPQDVVGLMGMVSPSGPSPTRLQHAGPVPRTLSDEALAAALASIEA